MTNPGKITLLKGNNIRALEKDKTTQGMLTEKDKLEEMNVINQKEEMGEEMMQMHDCSTDCGKKT
eukprot:11829912-Ditylum_brightwellii.AAC.1